MGNKDKDPFRGSTFLFDQSMSTQTLHLENAEQSYVPFYELWLSLRPRYYFDDHWRVQARLDYYKEFTNSDNTTYYREDVFGDIWTDLIYATPLAAEGRWKNTKVSAGAAGAVADLQAESGEQHVRDGRGDDGHQPEDPHQGDDAKFLDSARIGVSFAYLHPFTQGTTAAYGQGVPSETVADSGLGQASYTLFTSYQLTGQTLAEHQLYGILDASLQVTPKLGITLDWILINTWHYAPTNMTVVTPTGPVPVNGTGAGVHRVPTTSSPSSDGSSPRRTTTILPELSLGIGYYNLSNTVATDGTIRGPFSGGFDNMFWSPDARVFLDLTANLDKLYEDASGKYKTGQTAQAAQAARQQRIVNGIH